MPVTVAFSLTYRPVSSSPPALSWSEDGQLAVCVGPDLHILTPAICQTHRSHDIAITGKPPSDNIELTGQPLPLLNVTITVPFSVTHAKWTNDPRLVTPGAILPKWRTASWSPSNLSTLGTCLLVGVTTNYEVLVYQPFNNPLTGQWTEVDNLTTLLEEELLEEEHEEIKQAAKQTDEALNVHRRLTSLSNQVQSTSACWSPPLWRAFTSDRSLLAVGHRSGHVTLWRYVEGRMSKVKVINASTRNIQHLAWSSWSFQDQGKASVLLAVADDAGVMTALQLIVDLSKTDALDEPSTAGIFPLVPPDRRPVTQMTFVTAQKPTLVFTKVGSVGVLRAGEPLAELELEPVADYPSSGPWSPATGIMQLRSGDMVAIMLAEGSIHVVSSVRSGALALAYSSTSPEPVKTSEVLTAEMREIFDKLESRRILKGQGQQCIMAVQGASALGAQLTCIYFPVFPTAITHTQESKQMSLVVMAPLFADSTSLFEQAEIVLNATSSYLVSSCFRHLLPLCLLLRDSDFLEEHLQQMGTLLQAPPRDDSSVTVSATESLAVRLTAALTTSVYLQKLRLRSYLAQYCTEISEETSFKDLHAQLARLLTREVITRALTICETQKTLSAEDSATLNRLRIVSRGLVASPGEQQSAHSQPLFMQVGDNLSSADEACPACDAVIPLANARYGTCANGHTWERCSITLAILGASPTRTCLTCRRQVRRLPNAAEPSESNGRSSGSSAAAKKSHEPGMTETLLTVAKCCPFCGGRRSQFGSA